MRLREAGKEVIGMGMKKTPQLFIAACNKFVYIEVISHSLESGQVKEVSPESASIVEKESVSPLKEGIQILQASDNQLTFEVKGAGTIVAVGNADLKDTDSYIGYQRKAWKGRAIVVVKSTRKEGKIMLKVTSP